jgi:Fur family peroxide stress response transcriptional regulator
MRSELRQQRLSAFERRCREEGLPVTVQRRTILEAVLDRDDHPTADHIYENVRHRIPGVSRTTVYRVVSTLVRLGAITKACHPGGVARFDANTQQHHHLVCLHCDKVVDIHDKNLDALRLPDIRRFGFEIADFRVQLRGICRDCRKKAAEAKRVRKRSGTHLKRKRTQTRPSKSRKEKP